MPVLLTDPPTPERIVDIPTQEGPARAHHFPALRGSPRASLVLGHGAGGGVQSSDLNCLAKALPESGVEVVLVEAPWRVAGRPVAGAKATLDRSWVESVAALRRGGIGLRRLVVGGRSTGARVACRTLSKTKADAVLCLAFPLHKPGSTDTTRAEEIATAAAQAPVVVIQGAKDRYGKPTEVACAVTEYGQRALTVSVPFVDHSFDLAKRATITRTEARLIISVASLHAIVARRGNVGPLLAR